MGFNKPNRVLGFGFHPNPISEQQQQFLLLRVSRPASLAGRQRRGLAGGSPGRRRRDCGSGRERVRRVGERERERNRERGKRGKSEIYSENQKEKKKKKERRRRKRRRGVGKEEKGAAPAGAVRRRG